MRIISVQLLNHFLKLFDYDENNSFKKNAIIKKVACVTDADPTRKEANKEKSKFNKCFPYQLNLELSNFEYQKVSQNLTTLDQTYCGKQKIGIFARRDGRGKTFEYDFMFENPNCQLLLTEGISKKEEILNLMKAYEENKPFEDFLQLLSSLDREKKDIEISDWPEDEKKKAIIASRYLKSVENSKGEFALEISLKLKQNLIEKSEDFNLPNHIHEAIDFICGE